MNKKTKATEGTKNFLAYYEVQVLGATLYLHTVVKARDVREAGDKFFSQPTRQFGEVVLNPKGVSGLLSDPKSITMLQEVGGGINSKKLKARKPTKARIAALAAAGVTADDIAYGEVQP